MNDGKHNRTRYKTDIEGKHIIDEIQISNFG